MDIIDKVLSKLPHHKAPHSLRARILDIPEKKTRFDFSRLLKVALPAFMVLAVLGSTIYFQYFRVSRIAAAFELTVDDNDAAGISPDSVFILKSSKDINASQVKRVIKISPEVDFEVESDGKNRFRIKPEQKLSGNTIYQITIAEGAGERDFSWAFQVRAPFKGISTFPRNQATGVPLNSSVEVTFNREGLQNPEKYFEISPAAAGKFEVRNDTVVFVPSKPLKEKTIYQVTFKRGLSAKDSEEKLAEDIVFSFETAQVSYQPYSDFGFGLELVHFPTTQTPSLSMYTYNFDVTNSDATIYSFGSKDDFVRGYYQSRNWDLGWGVFYRQGQARFDTSKLNKVSTFKPQILKFDYQTFFEFPDKLAPGYYLVEVKANDVRRQVWILVNDISHYYSLTEGNGLVWAYQYSAKSPMENATVAFYDTQGKRQELGKTNNQGLAQFSVPDGLKAEQAGSANFGKPKILEIETPGKPATLALVSAGWWFYGNNSSTHDYWSYLSTDRYTYKLSDTLKFWGVLKGKTQDTGEHKVKVRLEQGGFYYDYYVGEGLQHDNKPYAETESTISPFETFAGSLRFQGLNPGTYQVSVYMDDKVLTQTSVEILEYVKPLYQISVTPSKQSLFAGESVDFNVKAQFYDGTPVGALQLKYTGYDTANGAVDGTVTLNARGEGRVTLTPKYNQDQYYPYSYNLSFYPALAEEAEVTSQSETSVLVFGPRVYLQSSQKFNGGDSFSITAKANRIVLDQTPSLNDPSRQYPEYIGDPVSGVALSAEVEKTEYLQIEQGTTYDPINKISVPQYTYKEEKTIVQRVNGSTSANGEWVFNLNLPKQERVYYKINITGTDGNGRNITTTAWPYYYQNYNNIYYPGAPATNNRVILSLGFEGGQKEYDKRFSVGEDIKLQAEVVEGRQLASGPVLFYRYGHTGVGKVQISDSYTLQEKFGKEFKPAASYRAVVFGPYGFVESNTLWAGFKQEDARLNISIQPDKEKYRPGDPATINVEVKDKSGKTRNGEVNLSLVDEAVFDVVPYYWQQDILSSLYAVDYSEPRSGVSDFTPQSLQPGGGAESGGCFLAGTPIVLGDGTTTGIENVKVGDVVLTRASENDPTQLVPAIVQGISKHLVGSYLLINHSLKVTGEHQLYVNGTWKPAGLIALGDILENEKGERIVVTSIEKNIAPSTQVYNINVGKYHTYYAGGFFVHNAEKGGGYRSDFLDTAHFESKELKDGKATFTVKLPDNITSWRATVSAFDRDDIFAGQENKALPASLPFFVDAVISETYLKGDAPSVGTRSFGTDYNSNADTTYTVDVDGLNYHETKVARGASDFVLPALPVGTYQLKIKGKQGNMEDGIIRNFKVIESYFSTYDSKTTPLTENVNGLPGNDNRYTTVTFTDQGKAKFYYDLVWNQYQGGKRSDQVAVSYLAQKILKENFGSQSEVKDLDLSAYQVPGGGLGLFTYGDTDLTVSAKLADLVPNSVYQSQLKDYFRKTMRDEKADIHRIVRSLYGLASLQEPVLAKIQLVKDERDLTLEDRMYVALAFAKLGDREDARAYYSEHISPELKREAGQAWLQDIENQTQRSKLTTLAGAVASASGYQEDALAVWEYAREHYPQEDLDILERFMMLRDLIAKSTQEKASFEYELNGQKHTVELDPQKNGNSVTMELSAQDMKSIRFSSVRGQPVAISVLESFENPANVEKNSELSVKRTYVVNGRPVTSFTEGETVVVRLEYQIQQKALDGGYQVVDFLPSGMRPVTNLWQRGLAQNYQSCYQKGYPLAVDGNKVYFSAYHARDNKYECGTYVVEYYARTSSKGSFTAAPALIQSLKNYDSLNVSASSSVTIK